MINDAALDYMRGRHLSQIVIDKLAGHASHIFPSSEEWERHLDALGLTDLKVTPDPIQIASEGALWGAIHQQGLLKNTVIVSDDAGQFRVGEHALCWIQYLEPGFILGGRSSPPMGGDFEPVQTPDKFILLPRGGAWESYGADPVADNVERGGLCRQRRMA